MLVNQTVVECIQALLWVWVGVGVGVGMLGMQYTSCLMMYHAWCVPTCVYQHVYNVCTYIFIQHMEL